MCVHVRYVFCFVLGWTSGLTTAKGVVFHVARAPVGVVSGKPGAEVGEEGEDHLRRVAAIVRASIPTRAQAAM